MTTETVVFSLPIANIAKGPSVNVMKPEAAIVKKLQQQQPLPQWASMTVKISG